MEAGGVSFLSEMGGWATVILFDILICLFFQEKQFTVAAAVENGSADCSTCLPGSSTCGYQRFRAVLSRRSPNAPLHVCCARLLLPGPLVTIWKVRLAVQAAQFIARRLVRMKLRGGSAVQNHHSAQSSS